MDKKKKSIKNQAAIAITTGAVLVIVIVVNLFAQLYPLKLDFSAGKRYSIGDKTKEILQRLDKDLVIYGLFDEGKTNSEYNEVKELLEKYKAASKGGIEIRYIDPDKDTKIIGKLDPEGVLELKKNDFVVSDGSKNRKVTYEALFQTEFEQKTSTWFHTGSLVEQAFTGAIYALAGQTPTTLYFALDWEGEDGLADYTALLDTLKKDGGLVKTIDLTKVNSVPADAAILLFLSPKDDLTQNEAGKVKRYLDQGGSAAFLFDASGTDSNYSEFGAVLKEYGLTLQSDTVRATSAEEHIPGKEAHLLLGIPQSSVIPLGFYGAVFPLSRSICVNTDSLENVVPVVLAQTGEGDGGGSAAGGAVVAAASEKNDTPGTKVFVSGSGSFLSDTVKKEYAPYFGNNLYFFKSVLTWLAKKEGGVAIGAREYERGEMQVPKAKAEFIGFLVVIVLPLGIFVYGAMVWRRRRYL